MYSELYETWERELREPELKRLPQDFYEKAAAYLQKLKEESRMLDKRTAKAQLLKNETRNVKRMLRELVRFRYRKLAEKVIESERVPSDVLTNEEEKLLNGILPLAEGYQTFVKNLLEGHLKPMDSECKRKNDAMRFLKKTPAIIGGDMRPYGPFEVEDVASLPTANAKILAKQELAERIETN